MPDSPEPRDLTHQKSPSDDAGGAAAGDRSRSEDAAAEHARALFEACGGRVADQAFAAATRFDPRDNSRSTPSAAAEWAASGAMALTGQADGPPRFAAGPLATAARGAVLALRAVCGASLFASLDGPALLGERAALVGLTRDGLRSAGGAARLLAARDATLVLNLPRPEDWQLIPAWLGEDFASSQTIDSSADPRSAQHGAAWSVLAERIASRETDALVARGRLMGLAVAKAAPPPNTCARSGADAKPTLFTRHHETQTSPPVAAAGRRLRVLDLSALWAGPLATSLLAQAGLDVLKIEHPSRPDGARNGPVEFFDLMNTGKRSCALDLRLPRDRSVFESLLDEADIVVESARPRALAQLGYDAAGWVTAHPGRLWTSITGYGRTHEWIAFGDDAAVDAGLAWSPDPNQRDPSFCADAIADPLAGLHAAAIVLAHRARGLGGVLDLSLSDIARRCAALPCETLTLPIDDVGADAPDAKRFWLVDGDQRIPIAPPRARALTGRAPALAAPRDRDAPGWMSTPC